MEQYTFTKDYTDTLRNNVKNGDISAYGNEAFEYDQQQCFSTGITRRDDLLQQMLQYANAQNDYEAAIILYEAFPNLDRIQATYDPFWAYLSHVDLYPYMLKRFCKGKQKPSETDIKINWWHSSLMRRGLSNLWWSVKQSVDESHPTDKYHYTKELFKHLDFRQRRLGSSTLFRHKEAVIGILKYLEENVTDYFEGRSNFIIMYFNKQATMRQLSACDRDVFYNDLLQIKDDINAVKVRTEAADAVMRKEDDWNSEDENI